MWALLSARPETLAVLFGQVLLIGLMIGIVTSNPILSSFLILISAMWFGCSNAAQEIVKEVDIFRREASTGLSPLAYLLSKFVFWSFMTVVQSSILTGVVLLTTAVAHPRAGDDYVPNQQYIPFYSLVFGCQHFMVPAKDADGNFQDIKGKAQLASALEESALQAMSIILVSVCAVALGLLISSLATNPTQAQFLVPVILIPQLLAGGVVVTLPEMTSWVRDVTWILPSAAGQRIMDVAHVALTIGPEEFFDQITQEARQQGLKRPTPNERLDPPSVSNPTRLPQFLDPEPAPVGYTSESNPYITSRPEGKAELSLFRVLPTDVAWQNIAVDVDHTGWRPIQSEGDGGLSAKVNGTIENVQRSVDEAALPENSQRTWLIRSIKDAQGNVQSSLPGIPLQDRFDYTGREDVLSFAEIKTKLTVYVISSFVVLNLWIVGCLLLSWWSLLRATAPA
jgi:hypothetical protein